MGLSVWDSLVWGRTCVPCRMSLSPETKLWRKPQLTVGWLTSSVTELNSMCSQVNLQTLSCGEGSIALFAKPSKGNGQSEDLNSMAFRQGFLNATLGVRIARCMISLQTFFWLVVDEVARWCFENLKHQSSGSCPSGGYMLVVGTFHLVGPVSVNQLKDMHQTVNLYPLRRN